MADKTPEEIVGMGRGYIAARDNAAAIGRGVMSSMPSANAATFKGDIEATVVGPGGHYFVVTKDTAHPPRADSYGEYRLYEGQPGSRVKEIPLTRAGMLRDGGTMTFETDAGRLILPHSVEAQMDPEAHPPTWNGTPFQYTRTALAAREAERAAPATEQPAAIQPAPAQPAPAQPATVQPAAPEQSVWENYGNGMRVKQLPHGSVAVWLEDSKTMMTITPDGTIDKYTDENNRVTIFPTGETFMKVDGRESRSYMEPPFTRPGDATGSLSIAQDTAPGSRALDIRMPNGQHFHVDAEGSISRHGHYDDQFLKIARDNRIVSSLGDSLTGYADGSSLKKWFTGDTLVTNAAGDAVRTIAATGETVSLFRDAMVTQKPNGVKVTEFESGETVTQTKDIKITEFADGVVVGETQGVRVTGVPGYGTIKEAFDAAGRKVTTTTLRDHTVITDFDGKESWTKRPDGTLEITSPAAEANMAKMRAGLAAGHAEPLSGGGAHGVLKTAADISPASPETPKPGAKPAAAKPKPSGIGAESGIDPGF